MRKADSTMTYYSDPTPYSSQTLHYCDPPIPLFQSDLALSQKHCLKEMHHSKELKHIFVYFNLLICSET